MIQRPGCPSAQGLYDPANEHDACGVGFLANLKGVKSHELVQRAALILKNLTHRGAVGADPLDGDGAGIMIQMPDAFLRGVLPFELPAEGEYATGLVFLPKDAGRRSACENVLAACVESEGMQVLGWRDVPTNVNGLGIKARDAEPLVRQIVIAKNLAAKEHFELHLYIARRRAERQVKDENLTGGEYFYIPSLSSQKIVYKGMLLSHQLETYFLDLADRRMVSALAVVHQRYSTNTFPTWDLAHPYRLVAHNGEINTLRGNINWMRAREALLSHPVVKDRIREICPVVQEGNSDTGCFDNVLEMLTTCGYNLPHAMAMMVPEAWATKAKLDSDLKAFFEYHACLMEPWDGPANIVACDGKRICAILDRNGLRPARWWLTDEEIIYASEAGVLDIPVERIRRKDRLAPGKMLLVDVEKGTFQEDHDLKLALAEVQDYKGWVRRNLVRFDELPAPAPSPQPRAEQLWRLQGTFGYTEEEQQRIIAPMVLDAQEPVGSMGNDTPPAVLSKLPKNLFWYFKQLFAQVTNPPIDPIREELVMSLTQYLGASRNILQPTSKHCHMLQLEQPILLGRELEQLKNADAEGFKGTTLDSTFPAQQGETGMMGRLSALCAEAESAVDKGVSILVLSDRNTAADRCPIPSLLAVAAVHYHLIRASKRSQCSLVLETGEPREVHHFACLIGFGANAINPYLAFDTIEEMFDRSLLPQSDGNRRADAGEDILTEYIEHYIKAIGKGLLKVCSKMGISTIQSYCGAQIFQAVGLSSELVAKYFPGTASQVSGIGLSEIARETLARHSQAFAPMIDSNRTLDRGGEYHWRRDGEQHLMNPEAIALMQQAVRTNDYQIFKKYTAIIDDQSKGLCTLRGLFAFKPATAIPLDQVESESSIMRRFVTGAMSLGSISTEAHECMAIAMNRIGGKSNTGEGGEDHRRFTADANGNLRRSKIKQVASGRFGVTPHYLVNADELQIKMAQGAKPGEGGQLPGHKVSEYVAWLRYSVPGVTLISPPPHHDIYSIEDLAQLIFDLKNCNPRADISVKLVSEVGVGTVAAGVAKGHADVVIIAGGDGGTGASPMSSIKHAGVPWEIGLAETQQTLVLNDLRGRIRVQTDGLIRTGRDVVIAAMLGAEEYGFATIALMAMGCVMMRKCHLGTCPVGIATQEPALRKKFNGKPEDVINFFTYIARDVREHMAALGVRSLDELIGRSDKLEMNEAIKHWKSQGLDYTRLLAQPQVDASIARRCIQTQDHGLDSILDRKLIELSKPALDEMQVTRINLPIRNSDRTTCAMLGGEIARRFGREGLPQGTIQIALSGVAGQSFGAFLMNGIDLTLEGEANDYVGKGMAGGRIVIRPSRTASANFVWHENSIVGNTLLYGATGGEVFLAGRAGERFCVRNSGAKAVIEGVGDHGCEYMTGGIVVCLGQTGRNFAAGMSGGFAFIYDEDRRFLSRCNMGMVDVEQLTEREDLELVKRLIADHVKFTASPRGKQILETWNQASKKFVKVFPHEYRRILAARAKAKESGKG